ncbi:hypothetical protein WJX72_002253 [[Myrmecia] bisecta]|uniref:Uncharacterized protein n=1 Tax=[Myrmecia] bisecta TaxID=41462 RepID=A0AAW1PKE2_9CHLO
MDDEYRTRMLGDGIAEHDWAAFAMHFGRFQGAGDGVRRKYWSLQHGYAGDGVEGGKTPCHYSNIPFKLMVATALERLPGRVGTLKEIQETIASAYKSDLNWAVRKGRKTEPMWHNNCKASGNALLTMGTAHHTRAQA